MNMNGYWEGGIYKCTSTTLTHAVIITGYDNAGGYWIVKNSWGSTWNDDGYFKVGFGKCGIESDPYYAYKDLTCGNSVNENHVLHHDILNCPVDGTGLYIKKNGATLDCNNHTISGSNSGLGIFLAAVNHATIKNCTVSNFGTNFYFQPKSDYNFLLDNNIHSATGNGIQIGGLWDEYNSINNNNIYSNAFAGVVVEQSLHTSLSGNNIYSNDDGIEMGGYSMTFSGNNISSNSEYGIALVFSSHDTISGNNISSNFNSGIWLYGSNYETISGNNISNTNYDGIYLYNSFYNSFSSNNISENQRGIDIVSGSGNSIWNNIFMHNYGYNALELPNGNFWDKNQVGNYWDDFASNEGYPYFYYIFGDGNGVDHYPVGGIIPTTTTTTTTTTTPPEGRRGGGGCGRNCLMM